MKTLRDCCVIFGSTLATFSAITLIVYHASASDVQFRKRHLERRRKKLNVLRQRNKKNRSGHKTVSKSALNEEIIPPLAELGLVAYYEEGELERVATRLIIRELAVNPVALKRLSMMLSSSDIEDREFATDFLLFYLLRVSQGRADLSSYPIMYGLVLGFDRCLDTLKELKEEGKEDDPVAFSRNLALFMNYISILTQLCEDARHLHPAHQLCLYGFVDLCYKWNEVAPFSDRVWQPGMIPNIRDVQNKTSRFPYTYHVLQDVIIADYQMESTIEGLVEKLGGSGDEFSRSEEQMMATREFLTQFYESRMEEMPQFETPEESLAAARDFLVFFYDNYYDSVRRAEREIQNGTESDDTDEDEEDDRGPALPRVARTIPNVPVPPPTVPVDDAYTSEEDTCSEGEMPRAANDPDHYLGECVDVESMGECEANCACRGRQMIYPVGLPPEDGYDDHVHEEEGDDDDDEDDGEGAWEDDDEDEFGEDDDYDDGYGYDDDVYEDEFGRAFVGGLEAEEFMNPMNYIDPNSGGGGPLTLNRETGQFDLSPGALDIINELRATGVLPAYGSPGRQPDGPNGGANGANGPTGVRQ